MNARLSVALVALALPAAVYADRPDVKGIRLGATEAEVKQWISWADCATPEPKYRWAVGERTCLAKSTYASAESQIAFGLWNDAVEVIRITFPAGEFTGVTAALREKFGSETASAPTTVTSGAGVTYQNLLIRWSLPDGDLILAERYSGRIDQSSIMFMASDWEVKVKERRRVGTGSRAKDM